MSLKKSTNLYLSLTRLQIRNLPKREFFEKELKELLRVVIDEFFKANPKVKLETSKGNLIK
jgi:hypothetical protein